MFFNNPPKRPMPRPPMQPAPQPIRSPFMGGFGQGIVPAPQPTPQPAPQPVGSPFMSAFGNNIVPAPQPVQGPMTSLVNSMSPEQRNAIPTRPAGFPAIAPQQPTQGPSAFASMFGNGGFGQPIAAIPQQPQPFNPVAPGTGMFGGSFAPNIAPAPQPTTGLAGLGTMSPEQITQLQNNMGPQTLPANINQELAKMSPGYSNNGTQNMTGGLSSLGLS